LLQLQFWCSKYFAYLLKERNLFSLVIGKIVVGQATNNGGKDEYLFCE
jgi:hypothetical protein